MTWQKEKDREKAIKLVLFLISPFFAFIYSLFSIKTKSSFIVFFLFAVFFGMSFTVSNYREEGSIDGISYRIDFENDCKIQTLNNYLYELKDYFSFKGTQKDFYTNTISFIVSRFTNNYHYLFMVYAIIFILFALKSFKIFVLENNFATSLVCLSLAYLFMINDIFNINGVRFWTAAWVAVYATLKIFIHKNKKYYFLALITPFFHGAFWLFIIILLIGSLFSKYEKLWVILFIFSFFISNISSQIVSSNIEIMPPFLVKLATPYLESEYVSALSQKGSGFYWVNNIFSFLQSNYIFLLVFLFIKESKLIKSYNSTKNIYMFLLVLITISNFLMPIPSVGKRFVMLTYPLIAYIGLVIFKDFKYYKVFYLMPFVFSYYFVSRLYYYYFTVLEPIFYVSSPFYLIYRYL